MMTTTVIQFQNRRIPVYFKGRNYPRKAIDALLVALDTKVKHGKTTIRKCLSSLISIELEDNGEAILHCKNEFDTVALSLY